MIWVRRVARRGALKARVAAAEQLHGVLSSALKSSANRCSGARPRPWVAPVQPCGQAAAQHQRRHQSQPAAPGSALATTPSRTRPPRPPAAGAGRRSRAQPGRPARDRVDTAGQLLVTAGDNPQRLRSEAALAQLWGAAPIPAASAAPTVIGAIAAATVTPTVLWGGSLWSGCAATRRPGPMSNGAPTRVSPSSTSCAVASATSPASSTSTSQARTRSPYPLPEQEASTHSKDQQRRSGTRACWSFTRVPLPHCADRAGY